MKYNPDVHHRRSIRLEEYDYLRKGIYFITICTKNRENLFWKCRGATVRRPETNADKLNYYGKIVQKEWLNNEETYENIILDEYIIMPNHVHGIIAINDKYN